MIVGRVGQILLDTGIFLSRLNRVRVVKRIKKPRAAGNLVDRRELQNKTQKVGLKFADLKSNGK
ncbi:MAG: hypothetical protein ABI891_14815 [Acidobacteriota bacterium]